MRKILFALYLVAACLLISPIPSSAQSWQWAIRGGSTVHVGYYGPDENVIDMACDKWGNIYAVAIVYSETVIVDNVHINTTGVPERAQICIVSYNCEGTMRWYKMITGSSNDFAAAIKTDTLGGVYVSGRLYVEASSYTDTGFIGNNNAADTNFAPMKKTMFLAKFDTGGAYEWIRFPEPDTVTYLPASSAVIDMDVDGGGNCYLYCALKQPSTFANGAFVSNDNGDNIWLRFGGYLLKYNSAGQFQSGFHFPIRHVGNGGDVLYYKRDFKRNRNYLYGYAGDINGDTDYIANVPATSMYLACFDDAGHVIWMKHNTNNGHIAVPASRAAIDDSGYIYITGYTQDSFIFNGHLFTNPDHNITAMPFLIKLDTNGNNMYVTNPTVYTADVRGCGIAIYKDTLAIAGYWAALKMKWDNDSIGMGWNNGHRMFLTRFQKSTGEVIGIDTTHAFAGSDIFPSGVQGGIQRAPTCITSDIYGNFYTSAGFTTAVYIAGDTLNCIGGETDWFIAKYGRADCAAPTGVVENTVANSGPKLYPNPVSGLLQIDNIKPRSSIKVFDMMGRQVYSGTANGTSHYIDTELFSQGTYVVQLNSPDGARSSRKVVKF